MEHKETAALNLEGLVPHTRLGKFALALGLVALCLAVTVWDTFAEDRPAAEAQE